MQIFASVTQKDPLCVAFLLSMVQFSMQQGLDNSLSKINRKSEALVCLFVCLFSRPKQRFSNDTVAAGAMTLELLVGRI